MVKLKLEYSAHLMQRADSLKKTLTWGNIEGRREKEVIETEMVRWHH